MPIRCRLCRRRIEDRGMRVRCECGWTMDPGCDENHDSWCPSHGADAWVGVQEI